MFKYIKKVLIAISVLINVILGGHSNQTFSARNWAWKRKGWPNLVWLLDPLFLPFDGDDHCMTSWVYWRVRKDVLHSIKNKEIPDE